MKAKKLATGVGDEGGFAPNLRSNEEAIQVILEAVSKAGFKAGSDVKISSTLPRASSTRTAGTSSKARKDLTVDQMVEFLRGARRPLPDLLDRGPAR